MIYLLMIVMKNENAQNVEKKAKCGDFFSDARGNAKLMINFFCLITDKSASAISGSMKNLPIFSRVHILAKSKVGILNW